MKKFLKFLFTPFFGKKVLQRFFRLLFLLSLKGMNIGGGSTWSESGEQWVLEHVAKAAKGKGSVVMFDVGANVGAYALQASQIFAQQKIEHEIFSFEPSALTFAALVARVNRNKAIKPQHTALGQADGRAQLYSDGPESGLASLHERDLAHYGTTLSQTEDVQVTTLDSFCQAQNIARIDFLKIDVEGNELAVLGGAKKLLEQRRIQAIQFEFGGTDIDARIFFKDFYKLLSPNYKVYRVLVNGLEPLERYREDYEIFITTNFYAELQ